MFANAKSKFQFARAAVGKIPKILLQNFMENLKVRLTVMYII